MRLMSRSKMRGFVSYITTFKHRATVIRTLTTLSEASSVKADLRVSWNKAGFSFMRPWHMSAKVLRCLNVSPCANSSMARVAIVSTSSGISDTLDMTQPRLSAALYLTSALRS